MEPRRPNPPRLLLGRCDPLPSVLGLFPSDWQSLQRGVQQIPDLGLLWHCRSDSGDRLSVGVLYVPVLYEVTPSPVDHGTTSSDPNRTYIDDRQVSAIGLTCIAFCFRPEFRSRPWRRSRAIIFVLFGLAGIFPIFHAPFLYGLEQARRQMGWSWFFWGGLSYITGALIYAVSTSAR